MLEGDAGDAGGRRQALATMTLAMGRRVIVVDGAERWRETDVEEHLAPALGAMPPETTLGALRARGGEGEGARRRCTTAVKKAGGQIVAQMTVKPWELPKWVREQAPRLGLALDAAAAKALVAQVGERQQRLLRELEKLALEGDSGVAGAAPRRSSAEEIEARAAHSAEWRAYALGGRARRPATARGRRVTYLRLREQGERVAGLTYLLASAPARRARGRASSSRAGARRPRSSAACGCRRARRRAFDRGRRAQRARRACAGALRVLAALELDTRGGRCWSANATRSPRWTRRRSWCGRSRRSLANGKVCPGGTVGP